MGQRGGRTIRRIYAEMYLTYEYHTALLLFVGKYLKNGPDGINSQASQEGQATLADHAEDDLACVQYTEGFLELLGTYLSTFLEQELDGWQDLR